MTGAGLLGGLEKWPALCASNIPTLSMCVSSTFFSTPLQTSDQALYDQRRARYSSRSETDHSRSSPMASLTACASACSVPR